MRNDRRLLRQQRELEGRANRLLQLVAQPAARGLARVAVDPAAAAREPARLDEIRREASLHVVEERVGAEELDQLLPVRVLGAEALHGIGRLRRAEAHLPVLVVAVSHILRVVGLQRLVEIARQVVVDVEEADRMGLNVLEAA